MTLHHTPRSSGECADGSNVTEYQTSNITSETWSETQACSCEAPRTATITADECRRYNTSLWMSLPLELIEAIAEHLPSRDLLAVRLVSDTTNALVMNVISKRYFEDRCVVLSDRSSMQCLYDISIHRTFAKAVKVIRLSMVDLERVQGFAQIVMRPFTESKRRFEEVLKQKNAHGYLCREWHVTILRILLETILANFHHAGAHPNITFIDPFDATVFHKRRSNGHEQLRVADATVLYKHESNRPEQLCVAGQPTDPFKAIVKPDIAGDDDDDDSDDKSDEESSTEVDEEEFVLNAKGGYYHTAVYEAVLNSQHAPTELEIGQYQHEIHIVRFTMQSEVLSFANLRILRLHLTDNPKRYSSENLRCMGRQRMLQRFVGALTSMPNLEELELHGPWDLRLYHDWRDKYLWYDIFCCLTGYHYNDKSSLAHATQERLLPRLRSLLLAGIVMQPSLLVSFCKEHSETLRSVTLVGVMSLDTMGCEALNHQIRAAIEQTITKSDDKLQVFIDNLEYFPEP